MTAISFPAIATKSARNVSRKASSSRMDEITSGWASRRCDVLDELIPRWQLAVATAREAIAEFDSAQTEEERIAAVEKYATVAYDLNTES